MFYIRVITELHWIQNVLCTVEIRLMKMLRCSGLCWHVASLLSYILWGTSSCSVISAVQWSHFSEKWHQSVYQVVKMKCGVLESCRGAWDRSDTTASSAVLVRTLTYVTIRASVFWEMLLNKSRKSWLWSYSTECVSQEGQHARVYRQDYMTRYQMIPWLISCHTGEL